MLTKYLNKQVMYNDLGRACARMRHLYRVRVETRKEKRPLERPGRR